MQSPGGLHLVDKYNDNQMLYRVIATGPGRLLKNGDYLPIESRVGDRILCHAFQGTRFTFEDKRKIIDAGDVMMVLPP